jgi:hypothetical protein
MVAGKETSLDLFIIVPGTPNKIWDLSVHVYYSNNLFWFHCYQMVKSLKPKLISEKG